MTKLGILLTTSPESENTHTVVRLAEAALAAGNEVQVFLMCDGVHNADDKRFLAILDRGAQVVVCAHNCIERSVSQRESIVWGSQYDLAQIVEQSDRFLAFN
ncbi:MAG: DsrE family protein [Chloroflexi bacterium]|nr:DsrE family protein [Chloroflexota bacterium]